MSSATKSPQALPFSLDALIVATPDTLGGKPRIAGRRIAVVHVKNYHLLQGMSPQQIAGEYDLPLEAVHAALAYYYAHRAEVDAREAADNAAAEAIRAELDRTKDKTSAAAHLQAVLDARKTLAA